MDPQHWLRNLAKHLYAKLSQNLPVSEVQILKNHFYNQAECEHAMQCYESGSGSDPDLISSVDPDSESGSGSRRAKMTTTKKKLGNFMF